uniref:palmitoyl-protein hydrolase n=1 Tax=Schistocephalus solidus TaxID=70667 RepID=A0A0X3PBZ6_SCHSO
MGNWLCSSLGDESSSGCLSCEIIKPQSEHLSTLIFLHGLGDTGRGWSEALKPVVPPHCKIVCPNAKPISIVINNRAVMPAWYDIYGMSPDAPQDEAGIRLATIEVSKLVQAEIEGGIPEHRIIVGGFSQGGGLALYYGLTSGSKLGGIVALSSWLPLHKNIMKNQSRIRASTDLPILQCHGLSDRLVPSVIGDLTHRFLLDFQMSKCSLQKFAGLGHGYNDEELKVVQDFLCETLSK